MATGASHAYGPVDATYLTPSTLDQEIKTISAFASNPQQPYGTPSVATMRSTMCLGEELTGGGISCVSPENRSPPPHRNFPPHRGEGVFTYPY
jgi:hypothetical protein